MSFTFFLCNVNQLEKNFIFDFFSIYIFLVLYYRFYIFTFSHIRDFIFDYTAFLSLHFVTPFKFIFQICFCCYNALSVSVYVSCYHLPSFLLSFITLISTPLNTISLISAPLNPVPLISTPLNTISSSDGLYKYSSSFFLYFTFSIHSNVMLLHDFPAFLLAALHLHLTH